MSDAKFLLNEIDLQNDGLGIIKLLKTKEIIKLGEDGLNNLLTPFLYECNLEIDDVKFFDFLFLEDEQMKKVLDNLINSLKYIYKTDLIQVLQNIIIINSQIILHRDNFDVLCKTIREMFFIKPEKKEDKKIEVKEENKAILEEYLRLEQEHQKEMEEQNKKNQKTLHQLVTIVASQRLWDYDKVLNMTYYRLINSIMSIFEIDNYQTFMQYATSGNFDIKNKNIKHWTDTVGK